MAEIRNNLLLTFVAATPVLTANVLCVNTKRVPRNGDAIAMAEDDDDDAQLVVDINTASITSMAPPRSHATSSATMKTTSEIVQLTSLNPCVDFDLGWVGFLQFRSCELLELLVPPKLVPLTLGCERRWE